MDLEFFNVKFLFLVNVGYFVIIIFLFLMIFVIDGVASRTLLERKVLGYVHIRKGPNKVGFVGIFQPFRDAIRLFFREQYFPFIYNCLIYYFSPIFGFFPSLFIWLLVHYLSGLFLLSLVCCCFFGLYETWCLYSNHFILKFVSKRSLD
jgi:NADH-ubiquinone oxidoreductase chain 1